MTSTEKYLRLRIPVELWQQLEALAKEDRRSITQLAILLLQKQLALQDEEMDKIKRGSQAAPSR